MSTGEASTISWGTQVVAERYNPVPQLSAIAQVRLVLLHLPLGYV